MGHSATVAVGRGWIALTGPECGLFPQCVKILVSVNLHTPADCHHVAY